MLKGIAASQGIALAKVYKLQQPVLNIVKTEASENESEKLENAFNIEVIMEDERLTSVISNNILIEADI